MAHATATVIPSGTERDRLWDQHVDLLPNFAAYPEQSGRVIPMIRTHARRGLTRRPTTMA